MESWEPCQDRIQSCEDRAYAGRASPSNPLLVFSKPRVQLKVRSKSLQSTEIRLRGTEVAAEWVVVRICEKEFSGENYSSKCVFQQKYGSDLG